MPYVYETSNLKRYRYPTHINDLVVDRVDCKASEVFMVVLEPGEAPPLHKHDDTEQVFYMLEGTGCLTVGEGDQQETFEIKPSQVIILPPAKLHSVQAIGGPVKYLCVDSFVATEGRLEASWDEHVKAVCDQQGWNYDDIVQ
jgi:quercetin dioxygenase-like cupin family protein